MDKSIKFLFHFLISISFITFLSCALKDDKVVMLNISNCSNIKYDSIRVSVFREFDTVIYNVKPGFIINKKIEFKNVEYKRGEHIASALVVFKDSIFFKNEGGLIDIPYSYLKDEYNYFIYDSLITNIKDHKPPFKQEILKIKDFGKPR